MPSAWAQHLSAYRASHPNATLKQAMLQASACYRKQGDSHTPKRAASNLPKAASRKYRRSAQSAHNPSSPWISHVQAYRASHRCSFKDALQGASKTYRSIYEESHVDVESIDIGKLWIIQTEDETEYINYVILETSNTHLTIHKADKPNSKVRVSKSDLFGIVSVEDVVDYIKENMLHVDSDTNKQLLEEKNLSITQYDKRLRNGKLLHGYSVLYKETLLENVDFYEL
jgi:hypothetical protein